MATSRSLNIAELSFWGARKGIDVLATGDFTHPAWRRELEEDLERDETSGLYRPKNMARSGPLFLLGTEISCVYKKYGKTRKVHNLVFAPDFAAADKISSRLGDIGRLDADGRPILRLDSRNLLEIVLEASDQCVIVPAHVWTPWYSLFGSRSGFDSLQDCYEDLSEHIFALETGLSSDPAMNRLCSSLDGYALISNSDAHSGANLGREANIFRGQPSWEGIFTALARSARREAAGQADCEFMGTLEFFPEEGKYHLDGHRNCGVSLTPAETRSLGGICPNCGKPLTIGVLHRITELADREVPAKLANEPGFASITPLAMIFAEIAGVGVQSAQVKKLLQAAASELGSELGILCSTPLADIRSWWEPAAMAIERMRAGDIKIKAGFDGEYGKITLFAENELEAIRKDAPAPGNLL